MKALVLGLAILFSVSVFADAPSRMVKNTLDQGIQILSLKSPDARNSQMCALIKGVINSPVIGPNLLGQYAKISTDQKGVKLFIQEIPSFITTQLISRIGSTSGTQIDVDDNSYDRGDGSYDVSITIHTNNGNAYNGHAIVAGAGKNLKLIDVTYMGFSVVQYLGNDIQKKIDDETSSDPQHPVTSYVRKQMAETDYIECN